MDVAVAFAIASAQVGLLEDFQHRLLNNRQGYVQLQRAIIRECMLEG